MQKIWWFTAQNSGSNFEIKKLNFIRRDWNENSKKKSKNTEKINNGILCGLDLDLKAWKEEVTINCDCYSWYKIVSVSALRQYIQLDKNIRLESFKKLDKPWVHFDFTDAADCIKNKIKYIHWSLLDCSQKINQYESLIYIWGKNKMTSWKIVKLNNLRFIWEKNLMPHAKKIEMNELIYIWWYNDMFNVETLSVAKLIYIWSANIMTELEAIRMNKKIKVKGNNYVPENFKDRFIVAAR